MIPSCSFSNGVFCASISFILSCIIRICFTPLCVSKNGPLYFFYFIFSKTGALFDLPKIDGSGYLFFYLARDSWSTSMHMMDLWIDLVSSLLLFAASVNWFGFIYGCTFIVLLLFILMPLFVCTDGVLLGWFIFVYSDTLLTEHGPAYFGTCSATSASLKDILFLFRLTLELEFYWAFLSRKLSFGMFRSNGGFMHCVDGHGLSKSLGSSLEMSGFWVLRPTCWDCTCSLNWLLFLTATCDGRLDDDTMDCLLLSLMMLDLLLWSIETISGTSSNSSCCCFASSSFHVWYSFLYLSSSDLGRHSMSWLSMSTSRVL